MPSKNRNRHAKGRAIPGGVGPIGLRTWGYDGLQAVTLWIKAVRSKHTAAGLSMLTGVPESSIKNVCDGAREPTPEMASKIAVALDIDLESIAKRRFS